MERWQLAGTLAHELRVLHAKHFFLIYVSCVLIKFDFCSNYINIVNSKIFTLNITNFTTNSDFVVGVAHGESNSKWESFLFNIRLYITFTILFHIVLIKNFIKSLI